MKKPGFVIFCLAFSLLCVYSAELPVAVVAPVETTEEIKKEYKTEIEMIHELLSGELANTRIIKMVVRTTAAMDQILEEHGFQGSTWSDKEKTAALGKALNAGIIIRLRIVQTKNEYVFIATALNLQTLEQIAMERLSLADIEGVLDDTTIKTFAAALAKKIAGDSVAPQNTAAITMPDNFVLIKGGTFTMGSGLEEKDRDEDESPNPQITISGFYMCKYEVTQDEYTRVMGKNPSHFKGKNLPVEKVTWYNAVEYCNRRSELENLTPAYRITPGESGGFNVEWISRADGYRLPTEAEWEYACRAKTTTPYYTGTTISTNDANYDGRYEAIETYTVEEGFIFTQTIEKTRTVTKGVYRQTTVAGNTFKPNEWGLYNMHGNVGEWCWDWYGTYSHLKQTNPTGPKEGEKRVVRSGYWGKTVKYLRSAYRGAVKPGETGNLIGFRLVRSIIQ